MHEIRALINTLKAIKGNKELILVKNLDIPDEIYSILYNRVTGEDGKELTARYHGTSYNYIVSCSTTNLSKLCKIQETMYEVAPNEFLPLLSSSPVNIKKVTESHVVIVFNYWNMWNKGYLNRLIRWF